MKIDLRDTLPIQAVLHSTFYITDVGAIQIIRDIQGGRQSVMLIFFSFLKSHFNELFVSN